jgi:Uma2 family endonuclease
MAQAPFALRRWKRVEYERLVELGVFDHEAVELIGGQLIVAEPQHTSHAVGVGKSADALRMKLPPGWIVRVQAPIALDDESVPEPDIALVPGSHDDYLDSHPERPALVIEVAESSLRLDRRDKGSLYARARLADYWIVNVVDRVVEIYREPHADSSAPYGWSYASLTTLAPPAVVTPLALPSLRIAASDLLPR